MGVVERAQMCRSWHDVWYRNNSEFGAPVAPNLLFDQQSHAIGVETAISRAFAALERGGRDAMYLNHKNSETAFPNCFACRVSPS